MMQSPLIRSAVRGDAPEIASLSDALGYPTTIPAVAERLDRLGASTRDHVLVAVGPLGRIVGWLHGAEIEMLESGRTVEILGLVVSREARRFGVGRSLVQAFEKWAAERGHREATVRSNVLRAESHPFYERLGYRRVKSQHVYRRALDADQASP